MTARRISAVPLLAYVVALAIAAGTGCGYHVRSAAGNLPEGIQSLGIPVFENRTYQFKLEQQLTGAVLREFSARSRIPVSSSRTGVDAVLLGELRTISSSPVAFGSDTFGSVFLVTVQLSVRLIRLKDSKTLWENNDFLYRERYQLSLNAKEFFSEENSALDRLSREFAASLVSTVLNR
jgi:hypothetical protein